MNTKSFNQFICLLTILIFSSCSKSNLHLLPKSDTAGIFNLFEQSPHQSGWNREHVAFMADPKVSVKEAEGKCIACHKNNLGTPKKLNCTIQCHKGDESQSNLVTLAPSPAPAPNICLTCHQSTNQNKFAHYPSNAGLCTTCHTVTDKHLVDGKDSVKTKDTANDCYRCHTRKDLGKTIHSALADDQSCVTCHNSHGGNQRFFIKASSVKELCTMCHEAPAGTEEKNKHGPVQDPKTCTNCHSPHSSDNTKMLLLPSKDLCLNCHNQEIQATISDARTIPNIKKKIEETSSQHTGAIMGDCTECHNPHGSKYNRILKQNYSISNYNSYPAKGENPYAICFTCHDQNMLNAKDFTDKTGFRIKNKKNLHWDHVVNANGQEKSLGRSCKICHDPHGSNQDFNINETWDMKGFPINIKFTKSDNGGQCTMTCHDVKVYTRE